MDEGKKFSQPHSQPAGGFLGCSMNMTDSELAQLKERVRQAYFNNYRIANSAEYIEKLGGGAPPEGSEMFSTAHVMHVLEQYERRHGSK